MFLKLALAASTSWGFYACLDFLGRTTGAWQ
jgi:hypothetical protein